MTTRGRSIARRLVACTVVALAGVGMVAGQAGPPIQRTVLLKQASTIPGREAVMVSVVLPPGAAEGRHTHAAEVYAFVADGAISLEVEGKPTVTLKAGDVFTVAPGQIHQATNNGPSNAKLLVVFIAETGKPLTSPAK